MIRRIDDFIETLRSEREKTVSIFQAVDEKKRGIVLKPSLRSLERMAWHIVQTLSEMPSKTGLLKEDPFENSPIPNSFAEIIRHYRDLSQRVETAVREKWTESDLEIQVELYGEKWANGKTLEILLYHEVHHRGEMVALMRMLEMKVPGIYGPSQEEWSRYGLPAQP